MLDHESRYLPLVYSAISVIYVPTFLSYLTICADILLPQYLTICADHLPRIPLIMANLILLISYVPASSHFNTWLYVPSITWVLSTWLYIYSASLTLSLCRPTLCYPLLTPISTFIRHPHCNLADSPLINFNMCRPYLVVLTHPLTESLLPLFAIYLGTHCNPPVNLSAQIYLCADLCSSSIWVLSRSLLSVYVPTPVRYLPGYSLLFSIITIMTSKRLELLYPIYETECFNH